MRLAHGLTQAELAEAVGLTIESLSRAERGTILPTVNTLGRLATALGTTIDALAGRERISVDSTRARRREPERRKLLTLVETLDMMAVRRLLAVVEMLTPG